MILKRIHNHIYIYMNNLTSCHSLDNVNLIKGHMWVNQHAPQIVFTSTQNLQLSSRLAAAYVWLYDEA